MAVLHSADGALSSSGKPERSFHVPQFLSRAQSDLFHILFCCFFSSSGSVSWFPYLEQKPEGQNQVHRSQAEKSTEPSEPSHRALALQMGPAMTLVVMAYASFLFVLQPSRQEHE